MWCVKWWRFGVHRSAVDVMRGKPASDKSLGRNHNQTRVRNDPAFTVPACPLTVTGRCMRRWFHENGGGCTIRTHGQLEATGGFQDRCNKPLCQSSSLVRRRDLKQRPLAYGASELPDCFTAQFLVCLLSKNGYIIAYAVWKVKCKKHALPFVVGRALRCGGMNRDSSRSQRNQSEFAVALASEDASVGSMVAVIFEWRRVFTTPKYELVSATSFETQMLVWSLPATRRPPT